MPNLGAFLSVSLTMHPPKGPNWTCFMLIACVTVLITTYGPAQAWFRCDQATQEFTLNITGSRLILRNSTVAIFPLDASGNIMDGNYVALKFDGVQEWYSPTETCYEADYWMPPGTLMRDNLALVGFRLQDLECQAEELDGVLPNGGITKTLRMEMRNATFPDLHMAINFTITDKEFTTTYPGIISTNFVDYSVNYIPTSYKVTLEIENYPWSGFSNNSHMMVFLQGSVMMNYSQSLLDYGQKADVLRLNLTSDDGRLVFREELDRGYLLDGVPWMNGLNHTGLRLPLGKGVLLPPFVFSFGFCKIYAPGFLPKSIIWDPQLLALFDVSSPPTENPSEAPASSKTKKVPLGVILGVIFGVIGAVIIFVIIYINSPPLQRVFQPFKSRHGVKDEKAIASRWNQARGASSSTLNTSAVNSN